MPITPDQEIEEFPIPTADAATNAEAIRDAIGVTDQIIAPVVFGHEEAIVHFMDQLIALQTAEYPGDGRYLVVGGGGDSMGTSSGFNPYVTLELVKRFGQGCVASSPLSSGNNFGTGQSVMSVTLGGSAALTSENFAYLPNGEYYTIPAASTVTETPNSANIHAGFRRVRCWYARRSGGGTLEFAIAQTGASITPKTVNTGTGTAGPIGYVDFDYADGLLPNGKPVLTVTASTATCHYLGCYMYLGSGFVPVTVGRGGSTYAQALSSNAANLATFCEAMDVRLMFHAVKEKDTDMSDLQSMMDRWYAQHPNCSHIWVGNTSSPSGDGGLDVTTNNAMRAKCQQYKWCFIDGQRLLRTVAYLDTIGSTADGWNESSVAPHLSLPARRFIATWIIDKLLLGLNVAGGRFSPASLEAVRMSMLSDTRQQATIWAQTSSAFSSSNFTQSTNPDQGRMTYQFTASPAPVANSGRAGKFMSNAPLLAQRCMFKYRIFDGQLEPDIMAVILVGGANQNEAIGMTNTSWAGFRIIHGVDLISSVNIPWIQFAVKGSGVSETLSPKIYHSSATGVAPYSGGTWRSGTSNTYWVEYLGNGTSVTKRFRAWHQSMSLSGSETRLAPRRTIADWSGDVTVGGTLDPSIYFGLITGASPTTPGGARSCSLEYFEYDPAPDYVDDYLTTNATQNLHY